MLQAAVLDSLPATASGHELVGIVESCPGGQLSVGTRVVVNSGKAWFGSPARPAVDDTRARIQRERPIHPRGFARYVIVAVASLMACPSTIEPAIAVLAQPLATVMHAVGRITARPGRALLLGYGPVGALAHLEVVRRFPDTVVTVSEPCIARGCLAEAHGAIRARESLDDERWPLVIDAGGFPGSLTYAISWTAHGGTVLALAPRPERDTIVPAELVERSLTIVGSSGFDEEFSQALAILHADPDRYRPLITDAVLLEEAPARLLEFSKVPAAGRILIRPWRE